MELLSVGFGFIFILFGALSVAALVYWIIAVVEVARIPDAQYRAAGTES